MAVDVVEGVDDWEGVTMLVGAFVGVELGFGLGVSLSIGAKVFVGRRTDCCVIPAG